MADEREYKPTGDAVVESKSPVTESREAAVDEEEEAKRGYVLDAAQYDGNVKLASDGKTVLIPQPSDDPGEPLNWAQSKKIRILIIISTISFLPEFGSALGIPALVPQSM